MGANGKIVARIVRTEVFLNQSRATATATEIAVGVRAEADGVENTTASSTRRAGHTDALDPIFAMSRHDSAQRRH